MGKHWCQLGNKIRSSAYTDVCRWLFRSVPNISSIVQILCYLFTGVINSLGETWDYAGPEDGIRPVWGMFHRALTLPSRDQLWPWGSRLWCLTETKLGVEAASCPPSSWQFSCQVVSDLCDPMDCSPPGSSVHGVLQARILEWVAISFFRGSSWPRNRTWVSHIAGRWFTDWAIREALSLWAVGIQMPCVICSLPGGLKSFEAFMGDINLQSQKIRNVFCISRTNRSHI